MKLFRIRTLGMFGIGFLAGSAGPMSAYPRRA